MPLAFVWALQSREAASSRAGQAPVSWLLREAMWAARPGLAVAPWDSLAHSGERKAKITLSF